MNRFLPIILLCAGFLLAFTAFASAKPEVIDEPDMDRVCIDLRFSAETPPAPSELKRCWHQIGMGKIVTACTPEPALAQQNPPYIPECGYGPAEVTALNGSAPLALLMDLPPPKA